MNADTKLRELGIELPAIPGPAGNYVHCVRTGNLLFLSGKGPRDSKGKVGGTVSVEQAYSDECTLPMLDSVIEGRARAA